ncbi:MAG: GumC family protein [Desulfobacteraceae bacterium]
MGNNKQIDNSINSSLVSIPQNSNYYHADFEEGISLRDYWHVFLKRKWWVLGVLFGTVGLALLVIFLMPPIYKGTTTLQIIQDNPSALMGGEHADPLSTITGSGELDRFYETQYKILQSPTLALGLIESLKLEDHPSYQELAQKNPEDSPEVIREKYAKEYILENLVVEPVKNSFLVNVSFKSTDKHLAQKIPEAIQREYLEICMDTRQQSYTMLKDWLNKELNRLAQKLETSERNVYAHGRQNDFLSLESSDENVIVKKYVELSKLLTTAQSEKSIKEAQYRQIEERGADAPLITNHPLIQELRQELITLEAEVTGSNKIYGPNYPEHRAQRTRLQELRRRLQQEIVRLEKSIQADYEAAVRAEMLLQNEFDLQKAKVIDLQNDLVQHHILKRDLLTNQTLYEGLLARMKEASIASTMVSSNVSVITPAKEPYEPWLPKPLLFVGMALALGSVFGLGTAIVVEYLDNSIKTTDDLEKTCRIPSLGVVPLVTDNNLKELSKDQIGPTSVALIPYHKPMSMFGEAVFHLRAAIMLTVTEASPQVILLTSANPSEGKTTLTQNLASAFANAECKCLVVDCDLRKPTLHKIAEQPPRPGLTNYLTGTATLEEIIHPTLVPNLDLIPAGPIPPNPHELLASEKFRNLIRDLRQKYPHILMDSPPIIGFADARALAGFADGVLLVVKHHATTREAGRLAVQLLSQNHCRILGGVLSMAQKDRLHGGYYGYYQYYRKYHEKYHQPDTSNS